MKRAKIVCTIGPASWDREHLSRMIEEGMNVARINFSHGTPDEHRRVFDLIRDLSDRVAIMQDLQGPKIRVGGMPEGGVRLREDAEFILSTRPVKGDEHVAHVTYPRLNADVEPGDNIYMSDGVIHLVVESVEGTEVKCRVVHGGTLLSHKGVNLPGVKISTPALTEKDREDLELGLELGVDYVALSFVRSPDEVKELSKIIATHDSHAQVVAKIEKKEALDSIDEIIDAADGIMVARGDLGVEVPTENVPIYQKMIIARCISMGKPVITATQMLESMIHSERPTRAEASDVANAVMDGSDAVMLSEESATGDYPVESVATMRRIIEKVESYLGTSYNGEDSIVEAEEGEARQLFSSVFSGQALPFKGSGGSVLVDSICGGAVKVASEVGATAIAVLTHTGLTASILARYRPHVPIVALTDFMPVIRRMSLVWGVDAVPVESIEDTETIFPIVKKKLAEAGYRGKIVVTAGIPTKERVPSNTIHLIEI